MADADLDLEVAELGLDLEVLDLLSVLVSEAVVLEGEVLERRLRVGAEVDLVTFPAPALGLSAGVLDLVFGEFFCLAELGFAFDILVARVRVGVVFWEGGKSKGMKSRVGDGAVVVGGFGCASSGDISCGS